MKQYTLLIVAVLISLIMNAQTQNSSFETTAKIILLNNDTLLGSITIDTSYKINNFKGCDWGQSIFFKQSGKSRFEKFRPKELNGFLVKTTDSMWAIFVSSQTLANFQGEEFYGKKFLLKILEGKMSVYYYYHPEGGVLFRDGSYWNETKNVTKVLYNTTAAKIYHSDIYEAWESKLLTFVNDCSELTKKLKAVKCRGWSFLQIANFYNANCKE